MQTPELSVIIPIRNRTGTRLENCLRSLRWQDIAPERVEIVLSDFGSDPEPAADILRLAERHGARVARTETTETWNRSKALNIGIQESRGYWVLCTDADMIFRPNFLTVILEEHADSTRDLMIHCRCHDLPEAVPEQPWEVSDVPELEAQAKLRRSKGTGACQAARRAFFYRARGYDEAYAYWGLEDKDMSDRARMAGLEIHWITERTKMLHQWHPRMLHDRPWQVRANEWRYRLTWWQVVKNARGWGKLPAARTKGSV